MSIISIGKLTLAIFFFLLSINRAAPQFFPPATTLHIRHDHQAGQADTWILPSPSGSCHLLSLSRFKTHSQAKTQNILVIFGFFFFSAPPQCSSSTGVIQEWPWRWGANLRRVVHSRSARLPPVVMIHPSAPILHTPRPLCKISVRIFTLIWKQRPTPARPSAG